MDETTADLEATVQHTHCPRCDYHLDGAVAAFTDQCPLQGTCPECGMEFDWANLLRADRQLVPWLFEHARSVVRGFLGTLWKSLFPVRFWNAVQMWHVPRVRRLWWYAMVCSGGLIVALSVVFFAICVLAGISAAKAGPTAGSATWEMALYHQLLYPFVIERWWGGGWMARGLSVNWSLLLMPLACLWGTNLSWPLMMLVLSDSRREAKVKRVHVMRAWAYSMWWGMVITVVLLAIRLELMATDVSNAFGWAAVFNQLISLQQASMQVLYSYNWVRMVAPICVLALFVWTARWWWVVIVRYWQFSKPGLVYWLIFVVSLLAMLIPAVLGSY